MPDAATGRKALVVLAVCTAICLVARGVGETFAVFLLPIAQEFKTERAALTGIYSTYMLAMGFISPIVGMTFDRFGARVCYGLGLLIYASACLLASRAASLVELYVLLGVGSAIGASMIGTLPASGLVSRWFDRKLPTAMGIVSASLGTGILLLAPISQGLIERFGWRGAYEKLGLFLFVILTLVMLLPWKRIAAGAPDVVATRRKAASAGPAWSIGRALRTRVFWALFFVMFFTSLSTYAVNVQLVALLIEAGVPPLRAASIFGLVGMMSIIGMIGAGVLAERIGEIAVAVIAYTATIAGVAALALVGSVANLPLIAAFVLLFGTVQGSRGPLVVVLSARNFPGGNQAGIYGIILLGMGTGGAVGSWGSGALYDLLGNYSGGLALSIAGAICGLLLFVGVRELRTRDSAARNRGTDTP